MEPPVGLCQRAFEDIVFWFAFDAHNDLCFPLIPKMTAPASALRMHANYDGLPRYRIGGITELTEDGSGLDFESPFPFARMNHPLGH